MTTRAPSAFPPHAFDRAALSAASREAARYDTELVSRFNAGYDAAFVEIVTRHRQKILLIALGFLRNRADAEEVAQDTFIRAHRGLSRFRGDSSLATWLHRIATNLSRNRYWHFFRRCRHPTQSFDLAFSPGHRSSVANVLPSDAPSQAREVMVQEFSTLTTRRMKLLNPRDRDILRRRVILDRSYEEIGTDLGLNLGTVKSHIARARSHLRALLASACPELERYHLVAWFEPNRPYAVGRDTRP
jgi:RNA polymerase sigma-70 factor, ECF subfamily